MTALRDGALLRFFSHPTVGVTGTVASVLGVVLAIWLYYHSLRTRDLNVLVASNRTTIVRAGQTSSLSVYAHNKQIHFDVTSVQIAVWNRGDLSIRTTDVLKPVQIVLPNTQILEASIRQQTRDVVNCRLDTSQLDQGRLRLDWDILEHNDGALIQVVYVGDDTIPVAVHGIIEGQPSVSDFTHTRQLADDWRSALLYANVIFAGLLTALSLTAIIRVLRDKTDPRLVARRLRIPLSVIAILALVISLAQFAVRITPPFDL